MNESKELIISKWYETGVLDDLDDIIKEKVALAFEEVTNFLDLENVSDKKFVELIFLFPLVRRVLNNIKNDKYIFNIEEFLKLVFSYNDSFDKFLKESDSNLNEASKVSIIADSMIDYINKETEILENNKIN